MAGAEPLLRRALAEAERSGRPRAIARASQSLYYLLRRQGRHAESVAALERKVDALRRLEGVDGSWTAEWRNELIGLYGSLGWYGRLEPVCRERLESDVRRYGARSTEASWALLTLAWAFRESGRPEESEALARQALALIEVIAGRDHPRTGWALVGLAVVRARQGGLVEAEAALRRARANWLAAGHTDRAVAVEELLIGLYVDQQRHEEALALSCAWFGGRPSTTDERQLPRVERHAALLRAVGRGDEAATWEARACELRAAIERRRHECERLAADAPETPGATSCVASRLTGPVFPSPLL
ncbi:MAG TPA: tetratricopeptide repeat protein [Candidatus Dormibacteraeota bacterium]